nr:RNA-directed DNA polymerase, eukaryota [Tanacetum cinerariifolium]
LVGLPTWHFLEAWEADRGLLQVKKEKRNDVLGLAVLGGKVTPTKLGRMTKPYSSYCFIAHYFNAGNLKMEVKVTPTKLGRMTKPYSSYYFIAHYFNAGNLKMEVKDKMNATTIVNVLKCFLLASGLKINLQKSKPMGIGIPHEDVLSAVESAGCSIFHTPFNFLGVKVGDIMLRRSSWEETI